jgi:hypothetical protein
MEVVLSSSEGDPIPMCAIDEFCISRDLHIFNDFLSSRGTYSAVFRHGEINYHGISRPVRTGYVVCRDVPTSYSNILRHYPTQLLPQVPYLTVGTLKLYVQVVRTNRAFNTIQAQPTAPPSAAVSRQRASFFDFRLSTITEQSTYTKNQPATHAAS